MALKRATHTQPSTTVSVGGRVGGRGGQAGGARKRMRPESRRSLGSDAGWSGL